MEIAMSDKGRKVELFIMGIVSSFVLLMMLANARSTQDMMEFAMTVVSAMVIGYCLREALIVPTRGRLAVRNEEDPRVCAMVELVEGEFVRVKDIMEITWERRDDSKYVCGVLLASGKSVYEVCGTPEEAIKKCGEMARRVNKCLRKEIVK